MQLEARELGMVDKSNLILLRFRRYSRAKQVKVQRWKALCSKIRRLLIGTIVLFVNYKAKGNDSQSESDPLQKLKDCSPEKMLEMLLAQTFEINAIGRNRYRAR
jgi:hypothetical protein